MDILNLLQGPMKDVIIKQVGQQFGIKDTQKANTAVDGVVAMLMGAISKNASTPEGAESLNKALERDHDGSILDNLSGFLSGSMQPTNPNTANGAGILNHLLGNQQENAAASLSKASGIDTATILKMMMTYAPIVLGMLGKAKAEPAAQQQGTSGLLDFIKGATQTVNQQPSNQNLLTQLLDKDGDGNVIDDIADMGLKSIFGKFLGQK